MTRGEVREMTAETKRVRALISLVVPWMNLPGLVVISTFTVESVVVPVVTLTGAHAPVV